MIGDLWIFFEKYVKAQMPDEKWDDKSVIFDV